jgi:hypothetical protein
MTKFFFSPLSLLLFLDPRSGMGKNPDPGSGINIPDPQHCKPFGVLDQNPILNSNDPETKTELVLKHRNVQLPPQKKWRIGA